MGLLQNLLKQYPFLRKTPKWLRKNRAAIIVVFGLLTFGLTLTPLFQEFIPFQVLDQLRTDWRFRLRGMSKPHPDIVLLGVTASTQDPSLLSEFSAESAPIQMLENGWPPPREFWAHVVDRLAELGAKTIAIDILFSGERPGNEQFGAAVARHREKLILGSTMVIENNESIRVGKQFILPHPSIVGEKGSDVTGHCVLYPDSDNVVRRVSYRTSELREMGIQDDSRNLTAFSTLAYEKFTGHKGPDGYEQLINFQGPPTTYSYIPLEEIFIDRLLKTDPKFQGGSLFKNKLVLIGPIAETFHDLHKTPFGEDAKATPGVEIHAHILGSLLQNSLLSDAPAWTAPMLALVATVLCIGALCLVQTALIQFGILSTLFGSLLFGTQHLFTHHNLLVPTGSADFCLLIIGVFGLVLTFTTSQLERALVRGVLDRYVSKNIASLVVEHSGDFAEMLKGEKKNVCILFSDVRGFTSIFETSDAVALVGQLNEYFDRMVRLILGNNGTLQKFIGDAIMAAWGDTHSFSPEEDAFRAVRTALSMRPALAQLNADWKSDPNRIEMKIGIGVNYGEVVVGEIGSPDRREFTLLGDAVNTAARFESATKQYHVDILIGGSVEALTRGKFVYRCVDLSRFKGKKKPVETFTPLSFPDIAPPEWLDTYHQAIQLFRTQHWAEARARFESVLQTLNGEDFLCQMYLKRIAHLEAQPPGPDWDGAHTLEEK